MTPKDMKLWRVRLALTQEGAGAALGVTSQTIWSYENDRRPIPRLFALACYGLEVFHEAGRTSQFILNPPEGDDDAIPAERGSTAL